VSDLTCTLLRHARVPVIPAAALEAISDVLGDTSDGLTGSEIARLLHQTGLQEDARDLLSLASLLHPRLDPTVRTAPPTGGGSMIEFPSKGDVLVRPAVAGEDPMMNACFMEGTWHLYATGYQKAATRLYEHIAATHSDQDTLIYPFVFNWRMCVELRLKELIDLGRFLTDKPRDVKHSHSLDVLWAETRALLDQVEPNECFNAVGDVVEQLSALDPDSQRTRYPIHKKAGDSFPAGTPNLHLENFQSVMLKLATFLDAASSHLNLMADWKTEQLAAEYDAAGD
jgi:hypothetical protein